jgi:NADPH-dependent glutamate synthase beta subunit-like oxidoreductase/ferredoxin/Pyruvate/2-oxoacid:ferredoxin oxidoreductase delta subunit
LETTTLNINGRPVQTAAGKTILEASLDAGIYIPHLCYHPDLPSVGACRLCLVEIEGMAGLYSSCTTPAIEGMVVKTKSPELDKVRRLALELILVNHPADCTACPKYLNCELQSLKQYLGIAEGVRLKKGSKIYALNTNNPLFLHDFSRCILCSRCVRACHDLRGAGVISFIGTGIETHIGTIGDRPLLDAGCRFCGACVEVCPTGALRDKDEVLKLSKGRRPGLVPCKFTCPAGIDVPRYIRYVREKKFAQGVAVIREKVPFPAVLGHVCNHPCEVVCRHGEINDAIAIRELKRFATANDDQSWKQNYRKQESTGKQVAVVGAGPAGLTAAYYLAKSGHSITVFEALENAGGMLRFGIPEYRLPASVLDAEIEEIESAGVEIRTNMKIESLEKIRDEGYDAVLVAIGTHQGQKLDIPGSELDGVLVSIPFLREIRRGNAPKVGKRVVVLGGGNVGFDCARSALRLGATDVTIACLESRDNMLATLEEIIAGCTEGITIHNSLNFKRIIGESSRLIGVECQDVKCFDFDENGRLNVECIENSSKILAADTVIFAIGQRPEIPEGFNVNTIKGNVIEVEYDGVSTGKEGIFAAGDTVTGTSSVIKAIAAGRQAAITIDSFLGGSGQIDEELTPVEQPAVWLGPGEGFASRRRITNARVSVVSKLCSFDEKEQVYDESAALQEAERCLQCDLRLKMSRINFWADYPSS